jgi:signal transduction histidine kinase
MNTSNLYGKILPALLGGIFLTSALGVFTIKYANPDTVLPLFFDPEEGTNRILFFTNFYIPFAFCSFALYGCLFSSGFLSHVFYPLIGVAAVIVSGYVLNDIFTINLCVYSAYVIMITGAFSPPKNVIISGLSILFFTICLFHPSFMGAARDPLKLSNPSASQTIILLVYLFSLTVMGLSIRLFLDKYVTSEAKVIHLNQVGTKMLLFNHRLQDYARNLGEEAVKKDRLRFTRDLHDSCGYVFTNIIAVSNAAISCGAMETGKMQKTFQLIRELAQEGLTRTRETLHRIRELQDPTSGSIDSVYQMKSIFEEIMGIKVDIEIGNMKQDYGPTVNTVLSRVVQEAFTNSVRHGNASRIQIQFWEFPASLTMSVADNGIGSRNIVKGIGLAGMEERLAAVGGTLEVFSPEDGGFRLKAEIPLMNADQPLPDALSPPRPRARTSPRAGGWDGDEIEPADWPFEALNKMEHP